MPRTESQRRALAKYENKSYDKILLRLRKDTEPTREQITEAATEAGETVNGFIIEAIKQRMNFSPDNPKAE